VTYPTSLTAQLRQELYLKSFSIFHRIHKIEKDDKLREIVTKISKESEEEGEKIVLQMGKRLGKMMDKGLFYLSFSHSLIKEYLESSKN